MVGNEDARSTDGLQRTLRQVAEVYVSALRDAWGDALVAAALFGSVARGEAGPRSDVDLRVVARHLPPGRLARHRLLEPADAAVEPLLAALRRDGVWTDVSPVLKTPEEAQRLTPLWLDLVEDAVVLHDPERFLTSLLDRLRVSLRRLGARRLRRGSIRYWELKPDYRPGEVFEL